QIGFNRIFHPSDLSEASEVAFAHALRLALPGQSRLTILHTDPEGSEARWSEFPGVRRALERWGVLPPGSLKDAVAGLGLEVEKIATPHRDPVAAILSYLSQHPHDLIVLSTHQYEGLRRWLHKTVAEPVARRSGEMTLFIPRGFDGFVSRRDGSVTLRHVLIPVDHHPYPQPAIEAAASIAIRAGVRAVNFTLLHVGHEGDFPELRTPGREGWKWRRIIRQGGVEEHVLLAEIEYEVDLIVMTTAGHDGFLDALRGSTTERIVRMASCPVLAVPAVESAAVSPEVVPGWQPAV